MNFSESKDIYNSLKADLELAMDETSPHIFMIEDGEFPILVLETDKEVAGFGVLRDNVETDYDKSYREFKKLYAQNSKKWARLNISFVICRADQKSELEGFYNRIETDLYFCRKFVISYGETLHNEIERLPFIPLDKQSVVIPKRPLSAETIIEKASKDSGLAASLSRPNTKRGSVLLDECLKLENVPILTSNLDGIYQKGPKEQKQSSRLKSLVINDFRAYRGTHSFDLDADLIIIYGPNGLGKTSFFDAIDFVSTGGCGRFKGLSGGDDAFRESSHHRDADPDNAYVEMKIQNGSEETTFLRKTQSSDKALVNGKRKNRTKTLFDITGVSPDEMENRVETVTNLFRATHLFGQDFQTLTEGFGRTSELSSDIVSKMLAFQDYIRSEQKLSDIFIAINQKDEGLLIEENGYLSRKVECQNALDQVQENSVALSSPTSLNDWVQKAAQRFANSFKLPTRQDDESYQEYFRSSRAILEGAIKKDEDLSSKYVKAMNDIPILSKLSAEESLTSTRQKNIEEQIASKKDYLVNIQKSVADGDKAVIEFRSQESSSSVLLKNLNWWLLAQEENAKLGSEAGALKISLSNEEQISSSLDDDILVFEKYILAEKADLENLQNEAKRHRAHLAEVVNIANLHKLQKIANAGREKLKEELTSLNNQIAINKEKIDEKNGKKIELEPRRAVLSAKLSGLMKSESVLSRAIEELKQHVVDENCPACGSHHGSVEQVLLKLNSRIANGSQEIKHVSDELIRVQGEIDTLVKELRHLEAIEQEKNALLEESRKKIEEVEKSDAKFQQGLVHLGLIYEASKMEETIESLIAAVGVKIDECQEKAAGLALKLQGNQKKLDEVKASKSKVQLAIRQMQEKMSGIDRSIQKNLSEAAQKGILFDEGSESLNRRILSLKDDIENYRKNISELESNIMPLRSSVLALKSEISMLEEQRKEIMQTKEKELLSIDLVLRGFKDLGFSRDVSVDDIVSVKRNVEHMLQEKRILLSELVAVETAILASEVSLEINRQREDLNKIESSLQRIAKEREILAQWKIFFVELKDILSEIRSSSVAEFAEKYGPLSSTIQARLRSVFGFGDVKLSSEGGKISVTVERNNEHLRPIDYFSESQKQILVLSLFFAAAITQNWSSFAPIFLDDPVTHFDDLNAYAFLDLIAGMLQSEGGGRQFVISTCEEKLFQLMKQKFYGYGNRVKIYEFASIGEAGPVVNAINNGRIAGDLH